MTLKPFNTETGEVVEGRLAWIPQKKVNGFAEGWIAMSQNAMQEILKMKTAGDISGRDLDVLLSLTTILDFENAVVVQQSDLADKLQMARPHVSRSIKSLVEKRLLIEGKKVGRSKTYTLNPWVGWKGSAKNHRKELKNHHLRLVHSID